MVGISIHPFVSNLSFVSQWLLGSKIAGAPPSKNGPNGFVVTISVEAGDGKAPLLCCCWRRHETVLKRKNMRMNAANCDAQKECTNPLWFLFARLMFAQLIKSFNSYLWKVISEVLVMGSRTRGKGFIDMKPDITSTNQMMQRWHWFGQEITNIDQIS